MFSILGDTNRADDTTQGESVDEMQAEDELIADWLSGFIPLFETWLSTYVVFPSRKLNNKCTVRKLSSKSRSDFIYDICRRRESCRSLGLLCSGVSLDEAQ